MKRTKMPWTITPINLIPTTINIREIKNLATFKGSFLNMEKIHIDYFINSFKKKNAVPFAESALKSLSEEDYAEILRMAGNKEMTEDLAKVYFWFLNTQRSDTIPEFLINFTTRLEKSMGDFPQISNTDNILKFAELFDRIYNSGKFPRQKLIQRSQLYKDFDIDKEAFNDWLAYFQLEKYHGQREFHSLEYGEILRAFTVVDSLSADNINAFHLKAVNKLTIAKIIVGDSKSIPTVYRKLQKLTDQIDDLKPDNRKLIEWVSSHRKIPFSLAHRWVNLLLQSQNNPKAINTLEVFDEYFSQK